MSLFPEVIKLIEEFKALPLLTELSPEEARMFALMGYRLDPNRDVIVGAISERLLPDYPFPIPLRIYTPRGTPPFPIMVYFHGGGWVLGDIEAVDGICRVLCQQAGCIVVSVNYRLAPEYKFPAAVEDAYAATLWVSRYGKQLKGNPEKIIVAGDSAGANLATVVALMARDKGEPALTHQLLIYPVTNHNFDTPSYQEYQDGYFLRRDDMIWYWHHYLSTPDEGTNPLVSPLQADSLENLPPASIYTIEYDVLRSEAEAYVTRLQQAGVPVYHQTYKGLIHGCFGFPILHPVTKPILYEIANYCKLSLS